MLAEQAGYYRAIAGEYEDYAIPGVWGNELPAAIDAFAPTGRVLELACGPGVWTRQLLDHAVSVTAVEASAEMIAIASERVRDERVRDERVRDERVRDERVRDERVRDERVRDERVRFINANIFDWTPDGRYDVVFFGFWLSHVPLERFESFWALVRDCLAPDGRVFFVDDAHRTPDELVYGESSPIVRRRLNSGAAFRVVKVPHKPHELEQRLKDLGWRVTVTPASGRFFWGTGRPA